MLNTETVVTLSTGERLKINELFAGKPIAVVFLRHLGCTFCREHVRNLREIPVEQVVFVTTAGADESERFKKWIGSQNRFICDESASLFETFGIGRATIGQVISPSVILRGIAAFARGNVNGRPAGDPLRLGGSFVFDAVGQLQWSHLATDVADNASAETIKRELELANRERPESSPVSHSPAGRRAMAD